MLIVNLIGGLGNQMFQYAFGFSLGQVQRDMVYFDTTELLDRSPKDNFTYRDFELDVFTGEVPLAEHSDIFLFKYNPTSLLERMYYKVQRTIRQPQVYQEKQYYVYDPAAWQVKGNVYFNGYWQAERYFINYESLIRKAFTFRTAPTGKNLALAQKIQAQNAIAVHIRRGDYVSNPLSNQAHGTCSPAYYEEAVRLVTSRISSPILYIFSDEPDWVREHMAFEYPTMYVSHNTGKASFEDLRLMSLCKHNIIANSSFSWWGAWLNTNPDKIVVAPRQWLQNTSSNFPDLIPPKWIRL